MGVKWCFSRCLMCMADGICKMESLQHEIKFLESDFMNNRHGNSCPVIMTFLVLECSYCVDLSMYSKNVILRNWIFLLEWTLQVFDACNEAGVKLSCTYVFAYMPV